MNQDDALWLADFLECNDASLERQSEAAAELRRLHAQRDALLEALRTVVKEFKKYGRQHWPEAVKAQAAIDKVEENT